MFARYFPKSMFFIYQPRKHRIVVRLTEGVLAVEMECIPDYERCIPFPTGDGLTFRNKPERRAI